MSTIDPATSRRVAARLRERGVRFIDAPVSGGVGGAEDGTLAIMVGGDARDLEEARPVLAAMGANIVHIGAVGAGAVAKLCNNLIAGRGHGGGQRGLPHRRGVRRRRAGS